MAVLTSTLYCTAGCQKGTTPKKPREEKHHAKVTPFGSSHFISALGNTKLLSEWKSFLSLPVSFRNCLTKSISQEGLRRPCLSHSGAISHGFSSLPFSCRWLPRQQWPFQTNCNPSAPMGSLALQDFQQVAFNSINISQGPETRVTTNSTHQNKRTNISQTKLVLPLLRTDLCYLRQEHSIRILNLTAPFGNIFTSAYATSSSFVIWKPDLHYYNLPCFTTETTPSICLFPGLRIFVFLRHLHEQVHRSIYLYRNKINVTNRLASSKKNVIPANEGTHCTIQWLGLFFFCFSKNITFLQLKGGLQQGFFGMFYRIYL